MCFSREISLARSGVKDVTTKSEQYLAPGGQVELEPAKSSSWSGSGALLGDERCGNPDTSPDPVSSDLFVCVSVCAPERGHLLLSETDVH